MFAFFLLVLRKLKSIVYIDIAAIRVLTYYVLIIDYIMYMYTCNLIDECGEGELNEGREGGYGDIYISLSRWLETHPELIHALLCPHLHLSAPAPLLAPACSLISLPVQRHPLIQVRC